MPVTTMHSEYQKNLSKWQRYRDAVSGEDAVKARGETYLPKKSVRQSKDEYLAYVQRAMYFNASGRTKDGLVGLLDRVQPVVTYPESMQEIIDDVTLDGISLAELVRQAEDDAITVGRAGVLVDYPTSSDEGSLTLAEYERAGNRPYAKFYPAEAITNWEERRVGNRTLTTRIVLHETVYESTPEDEFASEVVERYRVLDLPDGVYRQRLFERAGDDRSGEWQVVEEIYPRRAGQHLPYIPFEFIGPRHGLSGVQKAPIADLADVNLSHYRTMADLENGRHWCGSPTPVFIGEFSSPDGDEVTEVRLGSESGIQMTQGSEAMYLEFTGAGLNELREADRQKREMMVVLGARILAPDQRQVEAAETAAIHRAGENSTLASIANSVSKSITRVMEYLRDWYGATGDVGCEINTDFMPAEMSPEELRETVAAWQAGALSAPELFERLQKGEIVRSDKSYEDHQEEIEAEGPRLGMVGGGLE
ncbi:MAG: DUF4055 domain-containing protein [Alkalispirochaeta sp.]